MLFAISSKQTTSLTILRDSLLESDQPQSLSDKFCTPSKYPSQINKGFTQSTATRKSSPKSPLKKLNNLKMPLPLVSKQEELKRKKKKLLNQLRQIDQQLQRCRKQKAKSAQKVQNQKEMHKKAVQLVARMNKERNRYQIKRERDIAVLDEQVKVSLKQFELLEKQEEEEREQRRKNIQQRIEDRKIRRKEREMVNRQSNTLIKELNSFELPRINPEQYRPPATREKKKNNHSSFLQSMKRDQITLSKQSCSREYIKKHNKNDQYSMLLLRGKLKTDSSLFIA